MRESPEEKAKYMVGGFLHLFPNSHIHLSKQCAIIAVGEIIMALFDNDIEREYWLQVDKEIKKI